MNREDYLHHLSIAMGFSHGNGNPSADCNEAGLHQSGSAAKVMGSQSGSGAYAEQIDSGIKKT
jgi:hypothetical protein